MIDNPSALPIQRPQYNSVQTAQGLGGLDHELGSNEHLSGISSVGHYPATSMNRVNAFPPARHSSAMPVGPGYDVPPHLAMGPGGHQWIESQRQLDVYPTPGMMQRIPFAPEAGPPQLEYGAPAITEVPNGGLPSQMPLHCNAVGPFRGVYSGVPVTEDLKCLAIRYLHNPGSNVIKLRIRRSRSGTVKVLIFLDTPVASGALRLEQFAPATIDVSNDGPPGHILPPLNVAGPSRGYPNIGHPVNSRMPVTEGIEDLASRYLHNPGSRVDKLRFRRSQSGAIKVLIQLEIDDTM